MFRLNLKSAFALILMLACSLIFAMEAQAGAKKKTKAVRPNYGRIEVTSNPAGYPILIDGRQVATTATDRTGAQPIDLQPGTYTVEVVFPNKTHRQVVQVAAGKIHCICLTYTKRTITRPCPTSLTVSAPSSVAKGDKITFSSAIAYEGTSALNYTWTVSPAGARIIEGAGTPTITVDTSELTDQPVTAILVVDDGSGVRECRQTAQATTDLIPPLTCKIFDRVPEVSYDDLKARLDNFAIELQNTPDAQGYVVVYTGLKKAGQYDRLRKRVEDYLVGKRGTDRSRLVIRNGGYRETDVYEFWIVPQGAECPEATSTGDGNLTTPPPTEPSQTQRRPRRSRRDD